MARIFRPHGTGVRGATLVRRSVLFEGPFGRIFRSLAPADFGRDDRESEAALIELGDKMTADPDPVKDGPDGEESGIPSAFTYLGQFIDHDLTFDPASSLQRQNDPEALVDYRTPRFDLDNIYGRGPDDQPYFYIDGVKFILGEPLTNGPNDAFDLPRSKVGVGQDPDQLPENRRAIIGDPRNDENVIISQLQGLFHRFHNAIADLHPDWSFERIQREVRFHYQWVVANDFLPAIIAEDVLEGVAPHIKAGTNIIEDPLNLEFFNPRNEAFMPLEFAAAAYRFGHSMVRPGYRLNDIAGPFSIFHPTDPTLALTGFREFPRNWAIDWARFIDISPRPFGNEDEPENPDNRQRMQLAYRIDTSLVNPLGALPETVGPGVHSLAHRNLLRGWRMRLPSGQAIARAMGVPPLRDDEIKIGKFSEPEEIVTTMAELAATHPGFAGNCPLWTYVLAETRNHKTSVDVRTSGGPVPIDTFKLGEVGGRIVAETFLGIMNADSSSYFSQDPLWVPSLAQNGEFGLRELIATALGVQVA